MTLFDADLGPSYRVAFSTRVGGVSTGAYASLNLGILTDDDPENVVENRTRLCAAVGAEPETATMAWQVHGARVERADGRGVVRPGTPLERCDGLWTDEPGRALMLLTADCLPVALARANGTPALAVLHVGWRGLLAGIVEAGVRSLEGGPLHAAVGPGIGPCCYEVGDEVSAPFHERFGDDVLAGRNLNLPAATERVLRGAGVGHVEVLRRCTSCEEDLFFSHRRDRGLTGRQGIVAALR
ncbi:MAG TPA: polyphenol oxidase family protein [Gaiellaceae bacterium]|nr:polyphenol oxidase family protein [Gaiellaceae bacterium]